MNKPDTTILVFGSSIAHGAYDEKVAGGWVARLARTLKDDTVYNLSIHGETTTGVLRRLRAEVKARDLFDDQLIIIYAIGLNDSATFKGKQRTSLPQFKKNLRELIRQGRALADKIYFVGFTPINEAKTQPVAWNKDLYYYEAKRKQYLQALREVCRQNQRPGLKAGPSFVELEGKLSARDLPDGVHPNARGHERIYRAVKAKLKG